MFTKINKPVFFNEKIMKKIFKNEKLGKKLSAKLISEVMNLDYDIVYNNIEKSSEEIAFSALTVNSTADAIYYSDRMYFDIEINLYSSESKPKQIESYVYQLYLGQIHTFKDYNKIKPIVQISIDSYDYLGEKEFIYKFYLMDNKYHKIVSDSIQMIHINLDYLRNISYNEIEKDELKKNLYFLICGNEELNQVYERVDKLMKEIIDESKKIAGIEKMNLYLTDEEMLELDKKHYIEVGREENRKEIVKSFYQNGASLELISKSTGLSIEDINKIIKEK